MVTPIQVLVGTFCVDSVAVPWIAPIVAVIVVLPAVAPAVASPVLLLIVATPVLLLLQEGGLPAQLSLLLSE